MLRLSLVLSALLAGPITFVLAQAPDEDKPADVQPRKRFIAPAVEDPDATIRKQIRADWAVPERKRWQIDYRPIKGGENQSTWLITGTNWRVRLNPNAYKLDDLDNNVIYEIDAVALDQNYGVIDFYIYHGPKRTAK